MRFLYVTGRDVSFVVALEQIVNMVPTDFPIAGGHRLRTIIATTNPNEDNCWCRESLEEILRAVQSQEPHASGTDVIDVANWIKYHAK